MSNVIQRFAQTMSSGELRISLLDTTGPCLIVIQTVFLILRSTLIRTTAERIVAAVAIEPA